MTTITLNINDQTSEGRDLLTYLQSLPFVQIEQKEEKELTQKDLNRKTLSAIEKAKKGETIKFSSVDELLKQTGCIK